MTSFPAPEAACDVLMMENALESMAQGSVPMLCCAASVTLSWLGLAQEAVGEDQHDGAGLRELQPICIPCCLRSGQHEQC